MGRLRKSNASGYIPNAYVQHYEEVNELVGGSAEAEKITLYKASLRTTMGKLLARLRPPPFSPSPVLTFRELHVVCPGEALETPGGWLFNFTPVWHSRKPLFGEDELAVALAALEGQGAIVRFGFDCSACYSLSQQLLKVTGTTASAALSHAIAIGDHIRETSEPGHSTGCLRDASEGDSDSGGWAEKDCIVLIRRRLACKIPSNGKLLCAAEKSRTQRVARKRSTAS